MTASTERVRTDLAVLRVHDAPVRDLVLVPLLLLDLFDDCVHGGSIGRVGHDPLVSLGVGLGQLAERPRGGVDGDVLSRRGLQERHGVVVLGCRLK